MREKLLSTESLNKPPTWSEQKCSFVFLTNNTMKESSGLLLSVGSLLVVHRPPRVNFCLKWFPLGLLTNKLQQARAGPPYCLLSCLISAYLPVSAEACSSLCHSLNHWPRSSSPVAGFKTTSHILCLFEVSLRVYVVVFFNFMGDFSFFVVVFVLCLFVFFVSLLTFCVFVDVYCLY